MEEEKKMEETDDSMDSSTDDSNQRSFDDDEEITILGELVGARNLVIHDDQEAANINTDD